MPKSENQKAKILYVAKYFLENSDEEHPVKVGNPDDENSIVYYLQEQGILADRRSVYRDIEVLRDVYGMDIESRRGGRYRLLSHDAEFDDLKLIADCIHDAKYLTAQEADRLIDDVLGNLCSCYQLEELHNLSANKKARSANKKFRYVYPEIQKAIKDKKKVRFVYMEGELNNKGTQKPRRKGLPYEVSPYYIVMNDGNYYLLAYDEKARGRKIRPYRLDRMGSAEELTAAREGEEEFANFDIATFSRRTFSMFLGERKRVKIRCVNFLLDAMVDRFGTGDGVRYLKDDDRHFTVEVDIEISNPFYAWLAGFGKRARVVEPMEVVEGMRKFIKDVQSAYEDV